MRGIAGVLLADIRQSRMKNAYRVARFDLMFFSAQGLFAAAAAPVPTPEEKALADFSKGMTHAEKAARIAAIAAFEAAKPPPSSWQLFLREATGDPDPDVRRAAFAALAKMPAHDISVAKMLSAVFDGIKMNDAKTSVSFAKAMEPSEFKSDIVSVMVDRLEKMRYPSEPTAYKGKQPSEKSKEDVKEKRAELKDMLAVFNEIAKSDVAEANKDTPAKIRKWWDVNQAKFVKADSEALAKYAKADAETLKAAKDAAIAAIGSKPDAVKK